MAKLAALSAYFYQAALAFGLLIAISNLLTPADYAAYSLFVSLVQFAGIAFFEWLRFACSRFYPGPDPQSEATERGVITVEFLASAGLCLLSAALALVLDVPGWVGIAGAATAILQGGGELHLTMLRFRQEFRLFSWLQGSRASIIAAATLGGAMVSADFEHLVIAGLLGNLLYGLVALVASRRILPFAPRWDAAVSRRHVAYGSVSAGASVAGMLAPLGFKAILTGALGPAGAAGPMLALDLLQKPFVLIVSAIQAIRYPMLVTLFDREAETVELGRELGRYYALLAGFAVMVAAGIIASLDAAALLVIAADLREPFLRTAPLITLMALMRALIQTLLPTAAHLRRRLTTIALLAVVDCVLMCGGALLAVRLAGGSDVAIVAGAAAGAALALAGGLAILRLLPFELPRLPLAAALAALAAAWGARAWLGADVWLSTGIALAGAAVASLPVLPRMLRWLAR